MSMPNYKHVATIGCLKCHETKDKYVFSYGGNMGASVERNVWPLLEQMVGDSANRVLDQGVQEGSPDYSWTCEVDKSAVKGEIEQVSRGDWSRFNAAFGTNIQ